MRIRIIAVGRLKAGPERDLSARYLDRLGKAGRAIGVGPVDVAEIAESRAATDTLRREQEGEAILRAARRSDALVVLDETGEDLTSQAFSKMIDRYRNRGTGEAAFVIGGADGTDERVRAAAAGVIRFGRATWPHQLVRIMLAEQLYRAATLISGHPYHRGGRT